MSKKRMLLHAGSLLLLSVPNITYLGCNFDILKEANAVAITMTALLIFAVIGVGAMAHIKMNSGVWVLLIGVFILSLANVAEVAGMALIIEGIGIAGDGYIFKPLITKQKIKELEADGKQVTYTRTIN